MQQKQKDINCRGQLNPVVHSEKNNNNKQTTDEIQQRENIGEKEGMTEDKVGGEDFTLEKKLLFSYVNEQRKTETEFKDILS